MSDIKLKPCPFCGREAILICPRGRIAWVRCDCGIETPAKEKKEIIKHWNTRKPMDSIVEQLEEIYVDMVDGKRTLSITDYHEHAIDIVRKGGVE